ncbi:hypothetical protein [Marinitenerispora sediminis]|uniref:hypothetical protein n=1 Tax=Marinitenerispora sediminis TaxID=1931232 RepID=UPI0011C07BFB|nr:hypothetical protein [Marinitenerispora sediminis]
MTVHADPGPDMENARTRFSESGPGASKSPSRREMVADNGTGGHGNELKNEFTAAGRTPAGGGHPR